MLATLYSCHARMIEAQRGLGVTTTCAELLTERSGQVVENGLTIQHAQRRGTMAGVLRPRYRDVLAERGYDLIPGAIGPDRLADVRDALLGPFGGRTDGRITNAWVQLPAVRALAVDPVLIDCASDALGGRAVAFQTLDFRVGTAQSPHADTIHFDTVPSGGVCAIWVALEDVGADQGPVVVYPGSHRWPVETPASLGLDPNAFDIDEYEMAMRGRIAARRAEPVPVTVRAGDAILWLGNLVHGGGPRLSGTTRWSQVTHYTRAGDVLVTPMRSHVERRRFMVRTVIDVADRRVVRAGPMAPAVVHSTGSTLSRVGGPPAGMAERASSEVIAAWRRVRVRAAVVRSARRAPTPS